MKVEISLNKIGSFLIIIFLGAYSEQHAQAQEYFDKNFVNETGLNIREIRNPGSEINVTQIPPKKAKTKKKNSQKSPLKNGRFRKNKLGNELNQDLQEDRRTEY